jgi:hypothetical protein
MFPIKKKGRKNLTRGIANFFGKGGHIIFKRTNRNMPAKEN